MTLAPNRYQQGEDDETVTEFRRGQGFSMHGCSCIAFPAIDLLIDRNDGVVNICEMKYSRHPYVLDKEEADKLLARLDAFRKRTGTKKILHLTLVSPCGLEHKGHWGIVQSQVTMNDLFA